MTILKNSPTTPFYERQINLFEIVEPVRLKCPNCQSPVCKILATTFEAIQDKYWIEDSDTIPLGKLLKEEDWAKNNFVPSLEEGTCYECENGYFTIEFWCIAGIIAETIGQNSVSLFQDHLQDENILWKNYIATCNLADKFIPPSWTVTEVMSDRGAIHSHLFGPFFFSDGCWQFGTELLLLLWDSFFKLSRDRSPKHYWAIVYCSEDGQISQIKIESVYANFPDVEYDWKLNRYEAIIIDHIGINREKFMSSEDVFITGEGWLKLNPKLFPRSNNDCPF